MKTEGKIVVLYVLILSEETGRQKNLN